MSKGKFSFPSPIEPSTVQHYAYAPMTPFAGGPMQVYPQFLAGTEYWGEKGVRTFLARVTYKPGSYFEVFDHGDRDLLTITLVTQRNDIDNPAAVIPLKASKTIGGKVFTEKMLVMMVGDLLRYIELHELDEWFKLDGVHVTEPHPEKELTYPKK